MGNEEELNKISLSKEVSTTDFLRVKYKFRRCFEKSHNHVTTDSDAPDICWNSFSTTQAGLWLILTALCRGGGRRGHVGRGPACLSSSAAQGWAAFSADWLARRVPKRRCVPMQSHVNSYYLFPNRKTLLFGKPDSVQPAPSSPLSCPSCPQECSGSRAHRPTGPRFRKHPSPPTSAAHPTMCPFPAKCVCPPPDPRHLLPGPLVHSRERQKSVPIVQSGRG